jgi:hypothetical protein
MPVGEDWDWSLSRLRTGLLIEVKSISGWIVPLLKN